ncbi:LppA family lipoprotein [Knoellia sp. LjRoot47]|uniref:LppA family lipoprotein n=1 Tax=Knoellia sp. LjRoot47 TaxID=3342330 RepID=UPI003ED08720
MTGLRRTPTDRRRRARIATKAAAVVAALALLPGCTRDGGGTGTTPQTGDTVDARQQLDSRRSEAEAQRDNLALLAEVREALTRVNPALEWRTPEPTVESGSLCKEPFDAVDGAGTLNLTSGGALGAIPDADWPRAWAAVKEVAAKRGYGDEHTLKDEPGGHQMSVYDEDGSELSVGTGVNTTATVFGACYLTK